MSRQLTDVETMVRTLIDEHRKLLRQVDEHLVALKSLSPQAVDATTRAQETTRLRITAMEARRRNLAVQIAKSLKLTETLTLSRLAELFPDRAKVILAMRAELKGLVEEIRSRSSLTGRVAGAFLGHLNSAVRIIAGVAQQAGVYTKDGGPRMPNRIGSIEAVG